MAKRRREQIDADKIIKKHLNELGRKSTTKQRNKTNRIGTKPDTVLNLGQMIYGQWNYLKGVTERTLFNIN
jgi:hypothetical protein